MAVLVEAISTIIRADALLRAFGDFEQFKTIVPNETLCADNELVRVGFMHPDDVKDFVARLEAKGLHYLTDGKAVDIVVADQQRGLAAPCDWALFGHINWDGDPAKRVAACMAKGSTLKQLVTPDGWTYETSLTSSFAFVPTDAGDGLTLMDGRDGLDTLRSPLSDEPLFAGRTTGGQGADHPVRKQSWYRLPWGRS